MAKCPNRMVELPKSKPTQPRYSTTSGVTLYLLAGLREVLFVQECHRVGEEDGCPLRNEVPGDPPAWSRPLLGNEGGNVGVPVALAQKGVQIPA